MSLQRPSRTHSCPYSFRLRVYAIRLSPTWRTASSNAHYFWISHFDISRSAPRISLRWLVLAFLNITGMSSNPNRKCLWFESKARQIRHADDDARSVMTLIAGTPSLAQHPQLVFEIVR